MDFRDELTDDTFQFYLHVPPERFREYSEGIRSRAISFGTLRVCNVHGFYSDWSPSISTDEVKVLANLDDQKVIIPEGFTFMPPVLGEVGSFQLTITNRHYTDKPLQTIHSVEPEDVDEIIREAPQIAARNTDDIAIQRAGVAIGLKVQNQLKNLIYAAWIIVALLGLLVLRH